MANSKKPVTVTVDSSLLGWADKLVQEGEYESRSAAVEAAFQALHHKRQDEQLERALAAVTEEDIAEGVAMAEEGIDDYWGIVKENTW